MNIIARTQTETIVKSLDILMSVQNVTDATGTIEPFTIESWMIMSIFMNVKVRGTVGE
jgi:hypothetical protein